MKVLKGKKSTNYVKNYRASCKITLVCSAVVILCVKELKNYLHYVNALQI